MADSSRPWIGQNPDNPGHETSVKTLLVALSRRANGNAQKRYKQVALKHINTILLKLRLSCIARLPSGTTEELLEICAQIDKVSALTGLRKSAERVVAVPTLVTDLDGDDDDPEYTAEMQRMAEEAKAEQPPTEAQAS